jgi:hypothetical protein
LRGGQRILEIPPTWGAKIIGEQFQERAIVYIGKAVAARY